MEHIQNKRNIIETIGTNAPRLLLFLPVKMREDVKRPYTRGKSAPASAVILRGNMPYDRTLFPRPERGGMLSRVCLHMQTINRLSSKIFY